MELEPPTGPPEERPAAPPPPDPSARVEGPPPARPGPASGSGAGWYSGPVPIDQLVPRETTGAAIGRTAIKAMTALVVLGIGLFVIPFFLIVALAAIGGAAGGGAVEGAPSPRSFVAGESGADIKLVAVPVSGVILGEDRGGGGGFFAPTDLTYGYTVKEQLADLAEDEDVDGVILEIDSPGGTIFGSKAIAEGIEAYRAETGKPIIAYVAGMSASGGVYAMAGADEIYADHGTLVGSIGVIFGPFTFYDDVRAVDGGILGGGVTTEGGITVEFLTAGRSKDFGNPYRQMTDEERAVLQDGLDNAYDDFVAHVSAGRDIPETEIEKELGALIFGEQQALANGLIDGVANRDDVYRTAAEAAGLEDDQTWRVERVEGAPTGLLGLLSGRFDSTDEPSAGGGGIPNTAAMCLGSGAVLAYHGDPTALCVTGP